MAILIEFLSETGEARVSATSDAPDVHWSATLEALMRFDKDIEVRGRQLHTEWRIILAAAMALADARRFFGVTFTYNEEARVQLRQYKKERDHIEQCRAQVNLRISEQELLANLPLAGFTKRELRSYQLRDLSKVIGLAHAANFSVPGAGKTTVALALSLLLAEQLSHLIVIAPKNAFGAWDEVLADCIDEGSDAYAPFVRLDFGQEKVRQLLFGPTAPRRMIINYELVSRTAPLLAAFMSARRVHLILDESHRIKAGAGSQRGQSALALASFAARRDILSGTPVPNGLEDIKSQFDFLWPGQWLGEKAIAASKPVEVLGPLYVRTTKAELGLKPIIKHYVAVEMSQAQLALYSLMRDELLRLQLDKKRATSAEIARAGRSVLRLLQVASNPLTAIQKMVEGESLMDARHDGTLKAIYHQLIEEGDSRKIQHAVQLATHLVRIGEKVVIWSSFVSTVERLVDLLEHVGAAALHGQTPTGSKEDPETREGIIDRFHARDGALNVLVANPAACSEGISLHKVCHHAIYVDRSFNAAYFLQSVDRIHRLGLPEDVDTHVHILEAVAPTQYGSVDYSVRRRLVQKLGVMENVLNDSDLKQLMLDEDSAAAPTDDAWDLEDILTVIEELRGTSQEPAEDCI